jgi:F-type H+-transporting ATPase subunit delta
VSAERATGRRRAASREGLARLVEKVDQVTADLGPDQLSSVADDLASVVKLLARESVLTRHLADPADDP